MIRKGKETPPPSNSISFSSDLTFFLPQTAGFTSYASVLITSRFLSVSRVMEDAGEDQIYNGGGTSTYVFLGGIILASEFTIELLV